MSQKTEKKFRQMHRTHLNALAEQDFKKYHLEQKKVIALLAKKLVIWRVIGIAGGGFGLAFLALFLARELWI